MSGFEVLVGLGIAVGIVGIVVPVLPGLLLTWVAVLVWATEVQTTTAWAVLAVSTGLIGASQVVKYLVPGRRMRAAGVPNRTLWLAAALGVVGFFVVPVVGLPLGFVLGVYLAERARVRTHAAAWTSTVLALKAVGVSVAIELAAGLLVAATWATTVVAT